MKRKEIQNSDNNIEVIRVIVLPTLDQYEFTISNVIN